MGKRFLRALGAALLIALVYGTSAHAAVIVPLPGLTGSGMAIPAAQRTDTGGGVILAATGAGVTLARVEADGTPDLAYGTLGLAQIRVPADFTPTSLAVDPRTGTAWIAGSTGDRALIAAVSPSGATESRFGTRGVLTLPASIVTVRSIDWRAGALLVTGANPDCAGCQLTELAPASGRRIASGTVTAAELTGNCAAVRDTGAVWLGASILLATTQDGRRCRAQTVELPRLTGRLATVTRFAPAITQSIHLAEAGGQICEAGEGSSGISLWGQGQTRATRLSRRGDGELGAIVPVGGGACAALVRVPGAGAAVFQIAAGGAAAARTAVPAGFDAQTMYRCNAHLLVVGTVAQQAEILAVPLSQGPHVAHATIRRAQFTRTTGCT
jgi:hypothetical protein